MHPATDRDHLVAAVRRLAEALPAAEKEPDFPPMEFARIWVAFAETKLVVPVGVWTRCKFGPWAGPAMEVCDVGVHGYFLKDRTPFSGFLGRTDGAAPEAWERTVIRPGCTFEVEIHVSRRA